MPKKCGCFKYLSSKDNNTNAHTQRANGESGILHCTRRTCLCHLRALWVHGSHLQMSTLLPGFCLQPNASALYAKVKPSYNQASIGMWTYRIEFIAYLGKTEK